MDVRRSTPGEWQELRDLRLRALADAPEAFLMTLAEEAAQPDGFWIDRALRNAAGTDSVLFVGGDYDGSAVGFVSGPGVVTLAAMWVAPERRGRGLAAALVAAVVEWARSIGASRVEMEVVAGNSRAIALYERCGFRPTGAAGRVRELPALRYALEL